jgi:hypothetical protein
MAAGKKAQRREWTKEDVRTLKALAREGTKTTAIARKLKRTLSATHQKARALRVTLGGGRRKKNALTLLQLTSRVVHSAVHQGRRFR